MRNLKRALSLALASIMLLGMMVTGAGAASNSFTDFDQIVNQEAAEVTSGLGIFDGYTDGSFGPEKVVTRAEMAVIICKLLNGSDVDPGNFTGISKFTDVPAWAEGYVNYCAAAGIVVGVGEGKFNPSATVTTVEAATMLLKALGYFTEEDKLKEDWKTVVTGRATGMKLYGALTLSVDEGLTRDNVAELVFNTLFAQRVAYDDNRQLYVKNTNRDVVVTNGTQDYLNTFAENTFHMWVVDGLVTANSFTDDDLSETTNNAPRTNVIFDAAAAQDYPATTYQGSTGSEYPFEYTTGLDMIGHSARVYYRMERNAPVVFAIADRATKVEYITYDSNLTNLSDAANAAGFRRNTIREFNSDDYKVNYDWDVTVGTLRRDSSDDNNVDLTGSNKWDRNDPAKTLLVISNSTDYAVDCVIVLDQYLDTVKRVVTKNDVTEYDLTTIDGVDQNILHGDAAQGDYVVVTDIGKQGDMLNFTAAEKVSANITKITGKSDNVATVKSIVADGTTYAGSPVYDYRPQNSALDNTTDFEDIATIGEATLLLDFQGKCIGLAQPEAMDNYAYAAQFGVWHTGGSLNTEFKLTVKLYFLDGTSGVYLVNTDASQSVNTFYDLKLGKEVDPAEDVRDRLNGGDNNIDTDNSQYHVLKTYDAGIHVDGGDLYLKSDKLTNHNDVSGLGIYKVSVRADDTVVMQTLGDDAIGSQIMPIKNTVDGATKLDDETKLVTAHSTFVKQNGQNMTFAENGNVLFQDNKTVYFYVSGDYNDGLTVSAKAGVANAIGITNSSTNSVKDKDNNNEADVFAQILTKGEGGRKNELKRELVEAVMVWGYNTGSNDTLYFYRQNSYDIEHKDNASSRAGEKLYTITYHMFTMDGEPYEAHFNNGGKYYDMETAKETVQNKPTGYYTLGTSDIDEHWYSQGDNTIWYVKSGKVNGEINKVTHVNGVAAGAKNVYVIDATAYHDSYVDNLYTKIEDVGGIIPSTAKVISTVSNCDFDTINEIARACDNGALVKISYCYSTDDYKVKTVFITGYSKEGGNSASSGADLWSEYRSGWLYVFNDVANGENYIDVANSAKAAMEKAGYTVTNLQPYSRDVNNNICWTMEATLNGTKYYFTNGESGLGSGVNGWNYYVKITKETVRVLINGGLDNYYVPQADTFGGSNSSVEAGNLYNVQKKVQGTNNKWEFVQIDSNIAVGASKVIVYSLSGHGIVAGDTVNFVSATNTGKEYNVTGNIGANGTVLIGSEQVGTSPIKVREGSTVTLMVTPNNGYKLDGDVTVTGPNGPVTVSNNTFVMPAGNVTITATFVADKPADTVDVTGKTGEKIDLSSFKAGEEVVFAVEGDGTVAITPNGWYKVEGGSLSDGKNAVRASADGKLVFKFAPTADDIDNGLTITAISKKLTTISGTDLPAEMVVENGQIKLVPYNDLTATVVQSRAAEDPDAPAAFAPGSIIAMDIDGNVFYFVVKTNGDIVLKVTEDEARQVVDAINNAEPNPSTGLVDLNLAVEKETITNTEKFEATAENGKVTEVILPDAQPKAEGALLPKTLVIDGVEVEVEWYYNGDKVTETPAYAKAKTGYTYAVKNMQPTEGSNVSFAESVTVKKDVLQSDGTIKTETATVNNVKPGDSITVDKDGSADITVVKIMVTFKGDAGVSAVNVNGENVLASGYEVAKAGDNVVLTVQTKNGKKVDKVMCGDKALDYDESVDTYTLSNVTESAEVSITTMDDAGADKVFVTVTWEGTVEEGIIDVSLDGNDVDATFNRYAVDKTGADLMITLPRGYKVTGMPETVTAKAVAEGTGTVYKVKSDKDTTVNFKIEKIAAKNAVQLVGALSKTNVVTQVTVQGPNSKVVTYAKDADETRGVLAWTKKTSAIEIPDVYEGETVVVTLKNDQTDVTVKNGNLTFSGLTIEVANNALTFTMPATQTRLGTDDSENITVNGESGTNTMGVTLNGGVVIEYTDKDNVTHTVTDSIPSDVKKVTVKSTGTGKYVLVGKNAKAVDVATVGTLPTGVYEAGGEINVSGTDGLVLSSANLVKAGTDTVVKYGVTASATGTAVGENGTYIAIGEELTLSGDNGKKFTGFLVKNGATTEVMASGADKTATTKVGALSGTAAAIEIVGGYSVTLNAGVTATAGSKTIESGSLVANGTEVNIAVDSAMGTDAVANNRDTMLKADAVAYTGKQIISKDLDLIPATKVGFQGMTKIQVVENTGNKDAKVDKSSGVSYIQNGTKIYVETKTGMGRVDVKDTSGASVDVEGSAGVGSFTVGTVELTVTNAEVAGATDELIKQVREKVKDKDNGKITLDGNTIIATGNRRYVGSEDYGFDEKQGGVTGAVLQDLGVFLKALHDETENDENAVTKITFNNEEYEWNNGSSNSGSRDAVSGQFNKGDTSIIAAINTYFNTKYPNLKADAKTVTEPISLTTNTGVTFKFQLIVDSTVATKNVPAEVATKSVADVTDLKTWLENANSVGKGEITVASGITLNGENITVYDGTKLYIGAAATTAEMSAGSTNSANITGNGNIEIQSGAEVVVNIENWSVTGGNEGLKVSGDGTITVNSGKSIKTAEQAGNGEGYVSSLVGGIAYEDLNEVDATQGTMAVTVDGITLAGEGKITPFSNSKTIKELAQMKGAGQTAMKLCSMTLTTGEVKNGKAELTWYDSTGNEVSGSNETRTETPKEVTITEGKFTLVASVGVDACALKVVVPAEEQGTSERGTTGEPRLTFVIKFNGFSGNLTETTPDA